jgi:hypothetical protein
MRQGPALLILIHILLYLGVAIAHILTVEFIRIELNQDKQSTYYTALVGLSLIIVQGVCPNAWNIAILLIAS